MSEIKRLLVLADSFEEKLIAEAKKGEYGGKGTFELPKNHKAVMKVTKGGSSCQNCKFVDVDRHTCNNKYYIKWNGGNGKLSDSPLDEICSDWWQPK